MWKWGMKMINLKLTRCFVSLLKRGSFILFEVYVSRNNSRHSCNGHELFLNKNESIAACQFLLFKNILHQC